MSEFLTHPFKPFFDKDSKILILGSFPSVKSREDGFYYQHPRNRFWPILETLFDTRLE
ncbi:DNA-deoxyinosine glycosylase, partial [Campylobacter coli]|nr:DNA-deoxyinosine glycosylase [Campylobacter coli]